ncbi:capsule assembly Wzi family protein [candidate division WOR-3 bacterium]|uniref:Capsule assembly Wzi family protein n=1 Tax=candidate division WOR-3 bacterium TaxID=2052148 RepID=A0A937XID3_UNCW3|nr:capsule assembly Wzi family protein [candidate division WOR-3 bacterium]
MVRSGLLLLAVVALASAAGQKEEPPPQVTVVPGGFPIPEGVPASLENLPTDSRLYDDLDLLKTSGLISSMPATSKPWTRAECMRLLLEARSANPSLRGPAQLAALRRLEYEFGSELAATPARRPLIRVPVPDLEDAEARCDFFSRIGATVDTQHLSLGAVITNRPDDDFVFYERFELTEWNPKIDVNLLPPDSSGSHIPGTRVLPNPFLGALETELAYLAFRIPWLRLELGRDEFVWGSGYTGSVMLDDTAPALDHVQLCASYRNFKFLTFTSLLSRWGARPRWLAAQRIEASLWNRLTLGGAFMSVTSWDELQPRQFGGLVNPLIPILLTTANSSMTDNSLLGGDVVFYLPRTKFYAQLFLDNFEFNTLKNAPNAVGLQGGVYWAPNLPLEARLEYTRVTAFTYYHRVHYIMYENYLTTMGHPLGPDADQLFATVSVIPNSWLKVNIGADYVRRGYHNRGDYLRKSYRDTLDWWYLRQHTEFPTRGWDTLTGALTEEVDKTVRLAPGVEIRPLRDLFVSLSVGFWSSANHQGELGVDRNGVDLALKVEYRY